MPARPSMMRKRGKARRIEKSPRPLLEPVAQLPTCGGAFGLFNHPKVSTKGQGITRRHALRDPVCETAVSVH